MQKLSAAEAHLLGELFYQLARSFGDFRFSHWDNLTNRQRNEIESFEWTFMNYSSDFIARTIEVRLEDVQKTLDNISRATGDMKKAISRLEKVNKIFGIAAAAVKLAASIATSNPVAIATALDDSITVIS